MRHVADLLTVRRINITGSVAWKCQKIEELGELPACLRQDVRYMSLCLRHAAKMCVRIADGVERQYELGTYYKGRKILSCP